jgi:LysM domain
MDRMHRVAPKGSTGRGKWIRATAVALAVVGLGLALGTAAPTSALAEVSASGKSMSVPLAPNAPETYVVKKGDTLWDIAGVFLKYPWYWPEIWYVNPQVQNPHLIYPGDVLRLVYIDGKPRVTVETAGAVRLSPQVRSEPLAEAIRTVPYDVLMKFTRRPGLLDKKQIDKAPYIVGFRDRHIVGSTENETYATGLGKAPPGTLFTVVHVGDELRDPDDGDLLGYVGVYAATVQVISTTGGSKWGEGELTHLAVLDSGREILQGDKLLPVKSQAGEDFVISVPKNTKLNGQIISVGGDQRSVGGKYSTLAINRGKRDGLVPGSVVAIFARGEQVRDLYSRGQNWMKYTATYDTVQLPKERSGTLMLYSVHDRMSYGIVVESTAEMHIGDFIKHPDFGHSDAGLSDYYR